MITPLNTAKMDVEEFKDYLKYWNKMTSHCEETFTSDWNKYDESAYNSKLPDDKFSYLKRWFCCGLCLLDEGECHVIQGRLNNRPIRKIFDFQLEHDV